MGYNLLINGIYWGYNPLTNHLLTSWDIQVQPWDGESKDPTTINRSPGDSKVTFLSPIVGGQDYAFEFGSRELSIPKRSPATLGCLSDPFKG